MAGFLALVLALLATTGCLHIAAATWLAGRPRSDAPPAPADPPSVTLLKPLHGAAPVLGERLAGFLAQDYPGRIETICGVADPADPAIAVAEAAGARVVVDPTQHGANAKVSNLVNMAAHATGDVLVLSDDDIAVAPDYLRRVVAALAQPGVGCVTCLYAGRGDAGGWSRLAAAGISWQFLPNALVGIALGLAKPCMGSTIAMRRETLERIGGFARFADILADDYAIGAAVRAAGLSVAIPAMLVTHGGEEAGIAEIVRHELRWLATVRAIDLPGHAGSVITYPLALALIAALTGGVGWWLPAVALAVRLTLALRIDAVAGRRTAPLWMLPARDILGFALFLASFLVRRVDWRGGRLVMERSGRISAPKESPAP